jgi:two-component system, cell cycle response regulator
MRILIADDELMSRRMLEATLTRLGHEVMAVADGSAALEALLEPSGPRLAILDWMMPGKDGLEVCRALRKESQAYVYAILLTARASAEDVITGLDAGADDFLTKPFNAGELRARLRSGIRVLELESGLLEAQEKLRRYASIDHLTGLWNRRMILEQFDRELNRVRRENRPLTIALVDIDRFKAVNDTHGHSAGDTVLRETASAIRSQLREYDFVGRYGGEEFLMLLPGCGEDDARRIAERVRERIEATPAVAGDIVIPVTASFGLATIHKPDAVSSTAIIEAADEALYRAKEGGRNRVELADLAERESQVGTL